MKYLGSYDTYSAYETAVNAGDIEGPNVSLVNDKCYYTPILKNDFGDIAYYNTKTHKVEYYAAGSYSSMHHLAHMQAFGVVAVPAKYSPDGKTRIMSLKNMSTQTPTTGKAATIDGSSADGDMNMCWGSYGESGINIPDLPNLGSVKCVNPTTGDQTNLSATSASWVRIPSDDGTWNSGVGYVDPASGYRYYYGPNSGDNSFTGDPDAFGPYPILKNGDKNPLYYSSGMATNDFDGKGNTDIIIAYAENSSRFPSWASLSTYEPAKKDDGYFPAAFCCRRYDSGVEIAGSGDWYLPAEGELAFCIAKYDAINRGLADVQNTDSTAGIKMGRDSSYGSWLWSSSEYSSTYARNVLLYYGYVYGYTKSYLFVDYRVRAFIAL